jgi:hypothetical protein
VVSDGSIAVTMTGVACLHTGPAAQDYLAFASAATEKNLVLGTPTDNYILLSIARGQTELYRALTARGGMPLLVDMALATEGNGMLAGIVRKIANGSRVQTVTTVKAEPQLDTMFVVPDDWKRELKQ